MVAASIAYCFVVHLMFCMVLTYTDVFSHDLCRSIHLDEPNSPLSEGRFQNEPKPREKGLLCAELQKNKDFCCEVGNLKAFVQQPLVPDSGTMAISGSTIDAQFQICDTKPGDHGHARRPSSPEKV